MAKIIKTLKDAQSFIGRPVEGWKCSRGECSGEAGVIVQVTDTEIEFYKDRGYFFAFIGHDVESPEDYSWSTFLDLVVPELGVIPLSDL